MKIIFRARNTRTTLRYCVSRLSSLLGFNRSLMQTASLQQSASWCFSSPIGDRIPDHLNDFAGKLFEGDRRTLSRAITLLESSHPAHRNEGHYVLSQAMNFLAEREARSGALSLRIGISGPPGAGKSTFIETLGGRLTGTLPWLQDHTVQAAGDNSQNTKSAPINFGKHRVAVLAVDPTSSATGGSLLADKTRMQELSRDPRAYIRPSPSGGNLGGVARSTNEAVVLCEAAGYDIILVETVGVGQSETAVADMVDLFILLIPPAGGDEFQGIKRGIVEYADIVVVNKADGDLVAPARRIAVEYSHALRYQRQRRPNWRPLVLLVSSRDGVGLPEFWSKVLEFQAKQLASKQLQKIRKQQLTVWMWNYIKEGIWRYFHSHPLISNEIGKMETKVANGEIAPGPAAEQLIRTFTRELQG
ncbi:unnamed protein product [Dicrocoelium dendriticum]|nr:unnamed protein product [Dicrocoelium dendriticum]